MTIEDVAIATIEDETVVLFIMSVFNSTLRSPDEIGHLIILFISMNSLFR